MDDQSLTRFFPEFPGLGYDVSAASGNLRDASTIPVTYITLAFLVASPVGRRDELFDQSAKILAE